MKKPFIAMFIFLFAASNCFMSNEVISEACDESVADESVVDESKILTLLEERIENIDQVLPFLVEDEQQLLLEDKKEIEAVKEELGYWGKIKKKYEEWKEKLKKVKRRTWVIIGIGTTVLCISIAGSIYYYREASKAKAERDEAVGDAEEKKRRLEKLELSFSIANGKNVGLENRIDMLKDEKGAVERRLEQKNKELSKQLKEKSLPEEKDKIEELTRLHDEIFDLKQKLADAKYKIKAMKEDAIRKNQQIMRNIKKAKTSATKLKVDSPTRMGKLIQLGEIIRNKDTIQKTFYDCIKDLETLASDKNFEAIIKNKDAIRDSCHQCIKSVNELELIKDDNQTDPVVKKLF